MNCEKIPISEKYQDFTCVTDWEKLVQSLENGLEINKSIQVNNREFTLEILHKSDEKEQEFLNDIKYNRLVAEFVESNPFGFRNIKLFKPTNEAPVSSLEVRMILSTVMSSIKEKIVAIVPIGSVWRNSFVGLAFDPTTVCHIPYAPRDLDNPYLLAQHFKRILGINDDEILFDCDVRSDYIAMFPKSLSQLDLNVEFDEELKVDFRGLFPPQEFIVESLVVHRISNNNLEHYSSFEIPHKPESFVMKVEFSGIGDGCLTNMLNDVDDAINNNIRCLKDYNNNDPEKSSMVDGLLMFLFDSDCSLSFLTDSSAVSMNEVIEEDKVPGDIPKYPSDLFWNRTLLEQKLAHLRDIVRRKIFLSKVEKRDNEFNDDSSGDEFYDTQEEATEWNNNFPIANERRKGHLQPSGNLRLLNNNKKLYEPVTRQQEEMEVLLSTESQEERKAKFQATELVSDMSAF
ncbi:hypothetical protein ROZALSC1DRAFT_31521, partial [Rozella allomycis CSF55]